MIVVGTRPELIRLSRVIPALDAATALTLVHTGQNFTNSLSDNFFEELSIRKPDTYLKAAGDSAAKTISNIISDVDNMIRTARPDAFIILGDTNSALSVIAAKKRRIPIFHMEAGNRSFDERVPEEVNRRIIDHTSDINMPYTEHARRNLIREGFGADRIVKTGSPMKEILSEHVDKIKESKILEKLNLEPRNYILASAHREENVDDPVRLTTIITTLDIVSKTYGVPIILSTHPRTQKSLTKNNITSKSRIRLHEPFGFADYVALQMNAKMVLSDSGTITEESIILGFPAINLRESQERPEGLENGRIPMAGITSANVLRCSEQVLTGHLHDSRTMPASIPEDYAGTRFSHTVLNAIMSYTEYVRRVVWQGVQPNYD